VILSFDCDIFVTVPLYFFVFHSNCISNSSHNNIFFNTVSERLNLIFILLLSQIVYIGKDHQTTSQISQVFDTTIQSIGENIFPLSIITHALFLFQLTSKILVSISCNFTFFDDFKASKVAYNSFNCHQITSFLVLISFIFELLLDQANIYFLLTFSKFTSAKETCCLSNVIALSYSILKVSKFSKLHFNHNI
jgi:hypothetical protein